MNSGKTSKRKGKAGELEVARIFREHGYIDAKRSQQYCGADGDADIIGVPNLHIEVKRRKHLDIKGSLAQAESDCKEGLMPIVCYRGDRKPWIAVMRWDIFSRIYKSTDKLIKIFAHSSKNNHFYKWLEAARLEHTTSDVAVGNISADGHYVFMYLDDFIEMFKNSKYGGMSNGNV